MVYHIRTLIITSLILGFGSVDAAQLRNKQFIFGPVRVSPSLPRLGAVATLYGGWKLLAHADTAWLSGARSSVTNSVGNGAMSAGIFVAKAALLAVVAERVYDYTHTAANHATWPAYTARLLQVHVNELLVVKSLYENVIVRVSAGEQVEGSAHNMQAWQELLTKYQEQCETMLNGLMEIGWYVGDEVTVQLLEALRHDFDLLKTIKLDRFEIMNFVRHDELLYMRLQALYAACDHLDHTKNGVRAADVHVCHQELNLLLEMFDALQDTRAAALTDALHHCNRIANVKTSKDVVSGVLQYAQWRIANWWSAE